MLNKFSLLDLTQLARNFPVKAGESWMPTGTSGCFFVSDLGRVFCTINAKKAPPGLRMPTVRGDNGYLAIGIDGRTHLLHRVVLLAFVGVPAPKHECAHLNGDRRDCRLVNLKWVTSIENAAHKKLHGTNGAGECNSAAKLTAAQVRIIRNECRPRSRTHGCQVYAARFNVSFQNVWDIVKGRRWASLL